MYGNMVNDTDPFRPFDTDAVNCLFSVINLEFPDFTVI